MPRPAVEEREEATLGWSITALAWPCLSFCGARISCSFSSLQSFCPRPASRRGADRTAAVRASHLIGLKVDSPEKEVQPLTSPTDTLNFERPVLDWIGTDADCSDPTASARRDVQ